MSIIKVFDGSKQPPAFVQNHWAADVHDAVILADELVKKDPSLLCEVYDETGKPVYRR